MTTGSRFVVDDKALLTRHLGHRNTYGGNLVGNLTLARDAYASIWGAEVMRQLRRRNALVSRPIQTL